MTDDAGLGSAPESGRARGLTHVDAAGAARMVDVSAKEAGAAEPLPRARFW